MTESILFVSNYEKKRVFVYVLTITKIKNCAKLKNILLQDAQLVPVVKRKYPVVLHVGGTGISHGDLHVGAVKECVQILCHTYMYILQAD